jgi:hypothetical protein
MCDTMNKSNTYAAVAGHSFSTSKPSEKRVIASTFHLGRRKYHFCISSMSLNVRNKRDICDSELATDEPLLFGQNALQDTENTNDLIFVPLNGAGYLFWVSVTEPRSLTEVWTLAGRLEVQPLELNKLVVAVSGRDLVLLIVLVDNVLQNCVGFPIGDQ